MNKRNITVLQASLDFEAWEKRAQSAPGTETESAIFHAMKDVTAPTIEDLCTGWIPLCLTHPMSFNAMLLNSEADLRASLGQDPW